MPISVARVIFNSSSKASWLTMTSLMNVQLSGIPVSVVYTFTRMSSLAKTWSRGTTRIKSLPLIPSLDSLALSFLRYRAGSRSQSALYSLISVGDTANALAACYLNSEIFADSSMYISTSYSPNAALRTILPDDGGLPRSNLTLIPPSSKFS